MARATTAPSPPADATTTQPSTTPPPTPDPTTTAPPSATTTTVASPTPTPTPAPSTEPPATSQPGDSPTTTSTAPGSETSVGPGDSTVPTAVDETGQAYGSPVRRADGHVTRSIVFPVVGGYWLGSGWNDIRDGGARYHQGVDVIASAGQPVISPVDGRVSAIFRRHRTVGHGVVVTDDRGYSFRLFHMSSEMPDGLQVGERVVAGQLLGYVGGDQAIPHIHVELLRPSGVPVNPHWSLAAARFRDYPCADPATVAPDWSARHGMLISPDGRHYVLSDPALCRPPPPPVAPPRIPRHGAPPRPYCRPV